MPMEKLNKMPIYNICIFCGSKMTPKFQQIAEQLGQQIGKSKKTLIYGGASCGLMGVIASSVKKSGGKVIGVYPKQLSSYENMNPDVDELILVDNLLLRKEKMLQMADVFVVLPGGFGTIDEFFQVVTFKNMGVGDVDNKPVLVLNVDNFWDPLLDLCRHVVKEKFTRQESERTFEVVNNLDDLIDRLTTTRQQTKKERLMERLRETVTLCCNFFKTDRTQL